MAQVVSILVGFHFRHNHQEGTYYYNVMYDSNIFSTLLVKNIQPRVTRIKRLFDMRALQQYKN